MFATLLGSLPRPSLPDDAAPEALLDAVLELQVEHGLEPLIDGGWAARRRPGRGVARDDGPDGSIGQGGHRRTDHERPVRGGRPRRASVASPTPGAAGSRSTSRRRPRSERTPDARARFRDAHLALTADLGADVHLSLAITGGNADDGRDRHGARRRLLRASPSTSSTGRTTGDSPRPRRPRCGLDLRGALHARGQ